jgi:hypothetical protein
VRIVAGYFDLKSRRVDPRAERASGLGVGVGEDDWAAPGLVASLRKARLSEHRRRIDVHALTDVNNMFFKILATAERWPSREGTPGSGRGNPFDRAE